MSRFLQFLSFAIFILILPNILGLIAPFIIGFFIYLMCRSSVRRLSALGVNRGAASFCCLLFAGGIAAALCCLFFAVIYNESEHIPMLYQRVTQLQTDIPFIQKFLSSFKNELTGLLKELSVKLLSRVGSLTETLTVLLFSILSAFFFLKDEEKIINTVLKNGGDRFIKNIQQLKETACEALVGYIRAQLLLMCITFSILSLFLFLFNVKYPFFIALGTAFVDAIPVFGTGTILLPWALWQFLFGSRSLGFALLALYGVCSLTRQLLEPKILSHQIGLHPLLTLAGIFMGFHLFGLPGLILGPAAVLIFVTYIQKCH